MNKESYSNFECEDEIICPYCGKKYKPSEETTIGGKNVDCYTEGEPDDFTCDKCRKRFTLFAETRWEYITETIDGEMTKEEWEAMNNK